METLSPAVGIRLAGDLDDFVLPQVVQSILNVVARHTLRRDLAFDLGKQIGTSHRNIGEVIHYDVMDTFIGGGTSGFFFSALVQFGTDLFNQPFGELIPIDEQVMDFLQSRFLHSEFPFWFLRVFLLFIFRSYYIMDFYFCQAFFWGILCGELQKSTRFG